jgi:hypothetical protein
VTLLQDRYTLSSAGASMNAAPDGQDDIRRPMRTMNTGANGVRMGVARAA